MNNNYVFHNPAVMANMYSFFAYLWGRFGYTDWAQACLSRQGRMEKAAKMIQETTSWIRQALILSAAKKILSQKSETGPGTMVMLGVHSDDLNYVVAGMWSEKLQKTFFDPNLFYVYTLDVRDGLKLFPCFSETMANMVVEYYDKRSIPAQLISREEAELLPLDQISKEETRWKISWPDMFKVPDRVWN